ncbi:hypothetical protein [Streptococcus sp. zg-JUN1979]|uniref:hypothetical protein n=1 Tax=Streptococcus sp. zg-JUN1979 TaxID=3391450 RepID=UPI0039A67956
MKISDFLPQKDFLRLQQILPGWSYSEEYSESEIDVLDEILDNLEQRKGYDTEDGIFIGNVINRLRTHQSY